MAWLYRLPNSCIAFLFGVIGAALFDRAVDIFHRDFSAQIARDVSHKFLRVGVQTSVYDDPHMMLMSASLLGPDDAAIVFSHSGASTAVLEPIALARKQGARTIAVASYAGSPLAEVADVVLVSTSQASPLLGENAAARIAQLNILYAVFVAVAQRDYRAAERNLAKTMAAVRNKRKA
jgi:RpiR family transcriptional regulator, repressor of rpiB and als operon